MKTVAHVKNNPSIIKSNDRERSKHVRRDGEAMVKGVVTSTGPTPNGEEVSTGAGFMVQTLQTSAARHTRMCMCTHTVHFSHVCAHACTQSTSHAQVYMCTHTVHFSRTGVRVPTHDPLLMCVCTHMYGPCLSHVCTFTHSLRLTCVCTCTHSPLLTYACAHAHTWSTSHMCAHACTRSTSHAQVYVCIHMVHFSCTCAHTCTVHVSHTCVHSHTTYASHARACAHSPLLTYACAHAHTWSSSHTCMCTSMHMVPSVTHRGARARSGSTPHHPLLTRVCTCISQHVCMNTHGLRLTQGCVCMHTVHFSWERREYKNTTLIFSELPHIVLIFFNT